MTGQLDGGSALARLRRAAHSPPKPPIFVLAALVVLAPWLPGVPATLVVDANLAAHYALVAFSLVILTGWVGQISLGHGALVGVAAFATGILARRLHVPFPVNLPVVAALTAGVAALVGVVALRVRGLFLAVATLIFAWMADAWLFTSSWFVGPGGASSIRNRPIGLARTLTRFDLSHENVRYVVMVAVVAAAWFGAVNIRDSKTGRAFFAVRGSEIAAASLGVDVTRTKLTAFAISGALTGLAGNLLMTGTRTATPVNFQFSVSLFYLGVAVVGGITSLGGAVASSLAFAGLTELFFRVRALNGWLDVVTTGLLLGVILAYPGGLGALAGRRRDVASPEIGREPARAATRARTPARERPPGEPVLAVAGLSVRFGGLVAVDDVSLDVRGGEIAGLIGPNGAGKTTLFDTVLGLTTPSDGTVWMFGRDVTHLPVHARARTGVARTFQLVQVLGALTTFDNLLIATHGRDGTGLASHLFVTQRAIDAEAAARARVRDVLDLLELTAVAGRRVADLPFGVLRRIELARALVSGARLLLLDEPSSGLDTAETDRMAEVIASIPGETGASILLIEHDVRLVRAVCGHVYVIDGGKIVAQGPPEAVVRDPAVVAAYLGR